MKRQRRSTGWPAASNPWRCSTARCRTDRQDLELDLGVYLSQIAAAVMRSHAVEGIRLDLKVDAYPVSVNVAMPTGLVVNELLTNALKHAFVGRDGGTITLHSLADAHGCRIVVADDGVGLPRRGGMAESRQARRAHRPVAARQCQGALRNEVEPGTWHASDHHLRARCCCV